MDYSRNIGILTPEQQKTLAQKKLAILGLGMGSRIAELALRTGFSRILIADGDEVSQTNLNRQSFRYDEIGKAKSSCVRDHLLSIDSEAEITVVDHFIQPSDVPSILSGCDIVIDTIDLSSIDAILAVHEWCSSHGIPVVFPFNLGWKSMATVFAPGSSNLEEFIGVGQGMSEQVNARDFSFWAKFLSAHLPPYARPFFEDFMKRASTMKDWCPAPQIGATALTTSSLSVTLAVNLAIGLKTVLAPKVAAVDLLEIAVG
jgi:molybdopterin/thiamine biosynthesis adenylyltransferase